MTNRQIALEERYSGSIVVLNKTVSDKVNLRETIYD